MLKQLLSLVLCMILLLGNFPVVSFATEANGMCEHHTVHDECGYVEGVTDCDFVCDPCGSVQIQEKSSNKLSDLIAQLPEVSDPMGTEYYFYNQLSDIEKVMYWKISEASWEKPVVTISGVSEYTVSQLDNLCQRALTALIADDPEYHMYWNKYIGSEGTLSGDAYSFSLTKYEIASDYLIRKANAQIEEWVATVGQEGDRYSILRDLIELLVREVDYDYSAYLIGESNITRRVEFNDCILGPLVNGYAVCVGYSHIVKVLCDRLNIPCIVIGNAGHAWNMIRMDDDLWYLVDATADCLFEFYVDEFNLIGSESVNYLNNGIYLLSDPYLSEANDFAFPELASTEYHYDGKYTAVLHDADNTFEECSPRFVYKVNDDGCSCTIVTYEGPQTGDLKIPGTIDGYTVTAIAESAFLAMDFTGDLIIADTVKYIGAGAFEKCKNLSGELKLSSNVEKINAMAFMECTRLKGCINLPESLQTLGTYAFAYCYELSGDLRIPEGIEIGGAVFSYCEGLDGTIYLSDDLLWDAGQVIGTSLNAIVVNESNPNYSSYDGILYTKDMTTLICCPGGKKGSIIVPEGVIKILDSAFRECKKISGTLTLPHTLKEIGKNAFLLTGGFVGDLVIPNSVISIGSNAFGDAGFDGKLVLSENLEKIESWTFFGCNFTGDLIIPDSVRSIGDYAFLYCPFGGTLSLPEKLQYIGTGAFDTGGSFYGYFLNAIDLSATNVVIKEDAFRERIFPEFKCNCDAQFERDPWNERFMMCGNCKGAVEDCKHNWQEATCTAPKTCKTCGATEGEELGHSWNAATCTAAKTCKTCGVTEGSALGHNWQEATCTAAKTCKTCGVTEGSALGHNWQEATCTAPKTCKTCGATEGEELGHSWNAAICTTPKTCKTCGATEGSALGHSWNAATCTAAKTCKTCGATEGEELGHTYTDKNDATCDVCGYERQISSGKVAVYRLYNPYTHEHLLTGGTGERDALISVGWSLDGLAWHAPETGMPVYRLYNPYDDWHTYTTSESERDTMMAAGWTLDGAVSCSAPATGRPIYRLFNPYVQTNFHMFTASIEERDMLVNAGWILEGVAWYALN